MYTHKQAMSFVHVDERIPADALHPVRTEHESSEYPTAMHGYPSALESGFRTYLQVLPMRSRDRSRLFRNQLISTARSAGETGPPVPGVKPENLGHMTWPKTKTKEYKEVSCH